MTFDYRITWTTHNIVEAGQVYSRKELLKLIWTVLTNRKYKRFTVEWTPNEVKEEA